MQRLSYALMMIGLGVIAGGCNRQDQRAAQDAPAAESPAVQPAPDVQRAVPDSGPRTAAPGTRVVNPTGVDPRPVPMPQKRRETQAAEPATAPVKKAERAAEPEPVKRGGTLAAGTTLQIRTTSTLSTKTAKAGDAFSATLAGDLRDGDRVVAPRGATVEGRVVEADPGGRVRGAASLALELTRLELAAGRTVRLGTDTVTRQAGSSVKKDALKVGIGSGIGAAIGAIAGGGKGAAIGAAAGAGAGTGAVLATRGDAAVLPSESVLTFTLKAPVEY